jgi:anti-sigma factor RsiW
MNDDIHALSGAYAVDAVDEEERARFEQHLGACPECRAEVESLRAAATELSHLTRFLPPARLREQVLHDISAVRPLPPRVAREASDRIERKASTRQTPAQVKARRRWSSRWLAAAAAVVLVGGGAAVVTQPWDRQSQAQLTVAERVLSASDRQTAAKTFPGGASATVVRSKQVGRAVLVARSMPGPPAGKVYQLWLQTPAGTMSPAGLMPPQSDQTVVLEGNASTATAVGITVEPQGGSAAPTSEPIALFSFA